MNANKIKYLFERCLEVGISLDNLNVTSDIDGDLYVDFLCSETTEKLENDANLAKDWDFYSTQMVERL